MKDFAPYRTSFRVTGQIEAKPVSNHFAVEGKHLLHRTFATPSTGERLWVDGNQLIPRILKGIRPFGEELFTWSNNYGARGRALAILLHVLPDKPVITVVDAAVPPVAATGWANY